MRYSLPEKDKYVVCTVGRLYVAHWRVIDVPGLEEVESDLKRFMATHREPVIYASVTDAETAPPSDAARQRMVKVAEELVPSLRSFYIVVDMSGFRASMHRGTLAGMMLLTKLRGKVHVVASVNDVLTAEGLPGLGVDIATASASLLRAGVLKAPERTL